MVGAFVPVGARHGERDRVCSVWIHVPGIEAACSGRHADGGYRMGNRIIVLPDNRSALRDGYARGNIGEAL